MQSIYLLLIYLISRIPFLSNGYGLDADAWRTIDYGFTYLESGEYNARGYTGYPLYEYLIYQLSDKGPFITNSISAISGYFCIIIFKMILESHLKFSKALSFNLSLIFCFTPALWISSTMTMDYLLAQFLFLFSWYLIKNSKYFNYSAMLLGFAISARPNYIIFLLPKVLGLYFIKKSDSSNFSEILKVIFLYIFISISTSLLIFIPVIIKYGIVDGPGWLFSNFLILSIGFHSIQLFGVIGTCLMAGPLIIILYKMKFDIGIAKNLMKDPGSLISLSGIIVNMLLFIAYPDEIFYLIPFISFFLYLFARIISIYNKPFEKILASITIILFLNNFIDLKFWKKNDYGKTVFTKPHLGYGVFFNDFKRRESIGKQNEYIFSNDFKTPCIILTGGWQGSIIAVYEKRFQKSNDCDCKILASLDEHNLEEKVNQNINVYFTSGAESFVNLVHNYSLGKYLSKSNLITTMMQVKK